MADDDRSLVHELKRRKAQAWAQVYDRHAGDVLAFVSHLLRGNRALAEELHQETWLAALSGIDAFDVERGEMRGWIFGIARRRVALHFRRSGRAPLQAAGGEVEMAAACDQEALLPLDVIGSVERQGAVRAALAELGTEARDVLLGKYVDGRSVDELARQFGRSSKAVESRLSRARAQLRELLGWYFDTEDVLKDVNR